MLRTLERGSLIIVLAGLVGLGFWFGSRDSQLRDAIEEQEEKLESTDQRLGVEERTSAEHAEAIAENRRAIEELRAKDEARAAEAATLERRAKELEERLAAAEGDLEEQRALAAELAEARTRLEALEKAGAGDGKRIAALEEQLRLLQEDRERDSGRIDRLERALGLDP